MLRHEYHTITYVDVSRANTNFIPWVVTFVTLVTLVTLQLVAQIRMLFLIGAMGTPGPSVTKEGCFGINCSSRSHPSRAHLQDLSLYGTG